VSNNDMHESGMLELPPGTWCAICGECGQLRTVREGAVRSGTELELKCMVCKDTVMHFPVKNPDVDWREKDNDKTTAQMRQQVAQLEATETVLDMLGIHLRRRPMADYFARCYAERGPGWMSWRITLADDLSVPDQITYLVYAWKSILPAAEKRAARHGDWEVEDGDPRCSSLELAWRRTPADPDNNDDPSLLTEESIARDLRALSLGLFDATAFETPAERQERIAKTRLHGEARTQQFLDLYRQGLDLGEIGSASDWSCEVVRKELRRAGRDRVQHLAR
jgi:hypothetical protein